MIYFDNAATTMQKPACVGEAIMEALGSFGGVGRGVHPASLKAGMAVYRARCALARILGAPDAGCVSFANNATMALNIALQGLVAPGSAVLTTAASHNSVLRPLFKARDGQGVEVRVAPIRPDGTLDMEEYARLLPGVSLVAATHASNLTGDVYDIAAMARLAHEAGAVFVLDAAQTAGTMPFSMQELGVDVVCFTGHKGLYGPQGTGGLAVMPHVSIPPLLEGGSGVHSYDERHPAAMPEGLEAGTLNAHGIAGLAAGVGYIESQGQAELFARTCALAAQFEAGARQISGVRVYGGHEVARCAIVALNVGDEDSALVSDLLAQEHGIATRAGAHCAPLMHRALGTVEQGAVRFSFSSFNTPEEVQTGVEALAAIAARIVR